MTRVFIDLRDEERQWNGENGVEVLDRDSLDGADMALQAGETEIVLSVCQAITLFDALDAFVNGGPVREIGAIRRRVIEAISATLDDNDIRLTKRSSTIVTGEGFAHMLEQSLREKGVRWRLTGDREYEDHLARRARRAVAHVNPLSPIVPRPEPAAEAELDVE